MTRDGTFAALFGVLLFGVIGPASCKDSDDWGGGLCASPYDRLVEADALAMALADDALSKAECAQLCAQSRPLDDPQSDTDTDTTDGETGASTGTPTTTFEGSTTDDIAGSEVEKCEAIAGREDRLTCWFEDCVFGRRPAGLRPHAVAACSATARLFCEMAFLEAASVPAFERLAAALRRHGAPTTLQARALAAADDERRHAAQATELAAAYGGVPVRPEVDATALPDLRELALENAVEGCVGETWAALLARHQSRCAEDPAVRTTLAAIAEDETRHAELAWAIDEWLATRLSAAARAEVARARAHACQELRARLDAADDGSIPLASGLPRRVAALALFDGLHRALWLQAA